MALKTFYIGIKGLITKDQKVLVLKSTDGRGLPYWDIPGGRIDDDEEPTHTLLRELHEELPNIKNVEVQELIHAYRLSRNLLDGLGLMLLFFTVKADLQSDLQLSHEHSAYKWVGSDDIEQLGVNDGAYIEEGYKTAVRIALNKIAE